MTSSIDYQPPPAPLNSPMAFYEMAIDIERIERSPTNPRETYDPALIASLAESIKQHGMLQPVLVRPWPASYAHALPTPGYELVAGERRWRAAKIAGMTSIPARARELSDNEVLEMQVIENLQREDLHPLEEALGYERMMQSYGYTAEALAEKIHKSKSYIYARCKLTALGHEARKAFRGGTLNPSTALLIARIPNVGLQEKAMREITDPDWRGEVMSVRAAQNHLQKNYMTRLLDAPFPIDDADLIKSAGSCEYCPSRTGNQERDLFLDVESADVCIDTDCFAKKRQAHAANQCAQAAARGQKVITGEAAKKIMPYGGLEAKSGLVQLDARCFDDKEMRTYRELLSETGFDAGADVQLVENSRAGVMIEAIPKNQLAEALKAAGVTAHKEGGEAPQKALDAKIKGEQAYRQRLFETVSDRQSTAFAEGGAIFELDELKLLARMVFDSLYDSPPRTFLMKIWRPEEKPIATDFQEHIETLDAPELCLLMLDCALIRETSVNGYTLDIKPANLLTTAARFGIDPAEIRKQTDSELRKKANSAAKAAQAGEPAAGKGKSKGKKSAPKLAQAGVPSADAHDNDRAKPVLKKNKSQKLIETNEKTAGAETPALTGSAGQ